jgi:hypothetical protein
VDPLDAENFEHGFWRGGLKFQHRFDYSYDGVMRSFEDSLQRLGLPRIDLLLIHDLDIAHHVTDAKVTAYLTEVHNGGFRALADLLKSAGPEDDWANIELPVFGLIGPAAIPPVAGFISDQSHATFPAATAIAGIKEIARRHPACRAECIGILERMLDQHGDTDQTLNGFAVSALIDLEAVEAIGVIRGAFRRKTVDISIAGDKEDVEIALRLRAHRATPPPRYQMLQAGWLGRPDANRNTKVSQRPAKVGRNDPCPCGSYKNTRSAASLRHRRRPAPALRPEKCRRATRSANP